MFLNMTAPFPALMARVAFSDFVSQCAESANWVQIGIVLAIGLFLSAFLFIQKTHIYASFAVRLLLCTVAMGVAMFCSSVFAICLVGTAILVFTLLYQQDLRELLFKYGGIRHFAKKETVAALNAQEEAVNAICQVSADLSRHHVGALIVFERMMSLDSVARSGHAIDANVTPYLIRTIFTNKSPLHDGAVLISRGRLKAASCILKLSSRTDVGPELGTRHRAAIGITEISDAIAVVVSEETGNISVAFRGELKTMDNYQTMANFVKEALSLHKNPESGVQ